jgi:hypothetical protein
MKKMIALFTAVVFALTLGVAFAQEKAATPAAPAEKKAYELGRDLTTPSGRSDRTRTRRQTSAPAGITSASSCRPTGTGGPTSTTGGCRPGL